MSLRRPDFNPQVVARARKRFSSQILLAIAENKVESAIQVYEQTLALPQTETEAMLYFEGYELNGPCVKLMHEGDMWTLLYPEFSSMIKLEQWSGSYALVMPHFSSVLEHERD